MRLYRKALDRATFQLFVTDSRDGKGSGSDRWAWTHELDTGDRREYRSSAREVVEAYLSAVPALMVGGDDMELAGEPRSRAGCQGAEDGIAVFFDCDGDVERYERAAESFGQPFITHAYLCAAHAREFGFSRTEAA